MEKVELSLETYDKLKEKEFDLKKAIEEINKKELEIKEYKKLVIKLLKSSMHELYNFRNLKFEEIGNLNNYEYENLINLFEIQESEKEDFNEILKELKGEKNE